MLLRTITRRAARSLHNRAYGKKCPAPVELRKWIEKEDLHSLTSSFCNEACRPLFPNLREEQCCVDVLPLLEYAIERNSQALRILLVHNVNNINLPLLLEICVKHRNRNAFCLVADFVDKDSPLLEKIWEKLGLTGNMYFLKAVNYKKSALQGLIEGDHLDEAKAYAKYSGVEESGVSVVIWSKKRITLDVLEILSLPHLERYHLLHSTIDSYYLDGVKYLVYKNPEVDIIDLLSHRLRPESIDALRGCLPSSRKE